MDLSFPFRPVLQLRRVWSGMMDASGNAGGETSRIASGETSRIASGKLSLNAAESGWKRGKSTNPGSLKIYSPSSADRRRCNIGGHEPAQLSTRVPRKADKSISVNTTRQLAPVASETITTLFGVEVVDA